MLRRTILKAAGLAPLAVLPGMALAAPREARVTGLELFRLHVNKRGNWIVARLQTDTGLTGIGDASHGGHDGETIIALNRFAALLRGRSIFDVEWFRQTAAADSGTQASASVHVAISALEQCLWDLVGKTLGVPVYDLFGGKIRDTVRLYANINRSTDPRTPEGFAAMARAAVAAGFTAVKLAPFDAMQGVTDRKERARLTEAGIACTAAVRNGIGPACDLLIDAHSHFGVEDGIELARRMEPFNLFWLEEVTPANPITGLAEINRQAKMPTAGGEAIYGVKGFYPYIRGGAVDIVMPDIKLCGGMVELRKIAGLAEGAGLPVSPHGPASPIGNIAAAHVMATVPNFNILEFSFGEVPWRADLLIPPERVDKGMLPLSDRPGLGFELNDAVAARYEVRDEQEASH
jgi:galactonate dehydratase